MLQVKSSQDGKATKLVDQINALENEIANEIITPRRIPRLHDMILNDRQRRIEELTKALEDCKTRE